MAWPTEYCEPAPNGWGSQAQTSSRQPSEHIHNDWGGGNQNDEKKSERSFDEVWNQQERVNHREEKLNTREEKLDTREKMLTSHEKALDSREQTIVGREEALTVREQNIFFREKEVQVMEMKIRAEEKQSQKIIKILQDDFDIRERMGRVQDWDMREMGYQKLPVLTREQREELQRNYIFPRDNQARPNVPQGHHTTGNSRRVREQHEEFQRRWQRSPEEWEREYRRNTQALQSQTQQDEPVKLRPRMNVGKTKMTERVPRDLRARVSDCAESTKEDMDDSKQQDFFDDRGISKFPASGGFWGPSQERDSVADDGMGLWNRDVKAEEEGAISGRIVSKSPLLISENTFGLTREPNSFAPPRRDTPSRSCPKALSFSEVEVITRSGSESNLLHARMTQVDDNMSWMQSQLEKLAAEVKELKKGKKQKKQKKQSKKQEAEQQKETGQMHSGWF